MPTLRLFQRPCLLLAASLACPVTAAADVCFVKTTGIASNSGANWSLPLNLTTALTTAICTEIRVARGLYRSTSSNGYSLLPGVELYGGYEGVPGSEGNVAGRNPALHPTVLSGDSGGDDVVDGSGITVDFSNIVGGNTAVFRLANNLWLADTVVDGFTITGGINAFSCNASSAADECSPTLRNISFVGNRQALIGSVGEGGRTAMRISDSLFRNNGYFGPGNMGRGGAVVLISGAGGSARPTFSNVTFNNNRAGFGGVIHATSSEGSVDAVFSHVTMVGNSAMQRGGAMAVEGLGGTILRLTNSIVWGNTAPQGSQFYSPGGNYATLFSSIVDSGCGSSMFCGSVSTASPQLGPLQDNGGYTLTMMPGAGGSAIDAGFPGYCEASDQRGVGRPVGAGCDLGAVESTDPVFRSGFD